MKSDTSPVFKNESERRSAANLALSRRDTEVSCYTPISNNFAGDEGVRI